MSSYVIVTESSTDLTVKETDALGVTMLDLSVIIEGDEPRLNRDVDVKDFYALLRSKKSVTTSAINPDGFTKVFRRILDEGKDILYMGFSSGLSSTYSAGKIAAEDLAEKYPDRRILTVDTLCASLGQGLLVFHAAELQKSGADLDTVYNFVNENRLHLCHEFTVNDLFFLKRGGRVSAATAVLGTMLNIKPVMHVDNAGHLIKVGIARGRKASLDALVAKTAKNAIKPEEQIMFICHGDCMEDAEYVANKLRTELSVKEVRIGYTGPVIGAHSGPGTLAVFYLGNER